MWNSSSCTGASLYITLQIVKSAAQYGYVYLIAEMSVIFCDRFVAAVLRPEKSVRLVFANMLRLIWTKLSD